MKQFFLLSVLISGLLFTGRAQVFNITDGNDFIGDKARPCISVTFEPDASEAKKAWKAYLKKKYDLKLKKDKGNDLKMEEGLFPAITSRTIDFYTRFESDKKKDKNTTKMNVFVKFGYDVFLNKADNLSEYNALRTIIKDFAIEFLRGSYDEKLRILSGELIKIEKKKQKTIKDNENLSKNIEKNTKTIEDLKKESEDNKKQIEENKKAIETLTKDVDAKKAEIQKMSKLVNEIK